MAFARLDLFRFRLEDSLRWIITRRILNTLIDMVGSKGLMTEVSKSCHDHGQSVLLAVVNGILVSYGSARLYKSLNPFFVCHSYTIIKGEESVTGQHGTFEIEVELMGFFDGMPQ
jgi:hypothetical protein